MMERFPDKHIISVLRKAESGGQPVNSAVGMPSPTPPYYSWRKKFGGMEVPDVKRLKTSRRREHSPAEVACKEALQVALGIKVLTIDQKREAVGVMCDAMGVLAGLCQHAVMKHRGWQLMLAYLNVSLN